MAQRVLLVLVCLFLGSNAAFAQSGFKVDATVKLVDLDRNVALITIFDGGGIKILEVSIPPDTKFETPKGKKIKEGLKSDIFKDPINRPAVPITLQYQNVNGRQVLQKIVVK